MTERDKQIGERHQAIYPGCDWRVFTDTIVPFADRRPNVDDHDSFGRLTFNPHTGERRIITQARIDNMRRAYERSQRGKIPPH